jgi:kumamolisin
MEVLPVGVDGAANSLAGGPNDLWDNDPTKPIQSDPDVEVALDLEIVSSIAMGAKVVVYFAPDGSQLSLHDAVMMAVHDDVNAPSVISTSWGGAEESWSYGGNEAIKAVFQDAAMMGVTVLAPTGDQGSNCGVNDIRAHVEYPASDPGVLACGGTYIGNNIQGTWNDETGATGRRHQRAFYVPIGLVVAARGKPAALSKHGRPSRSRNPGCCGERQQRERVRPSAVWKATLHFNYY